MPDKRIEPIAWLEPKDTPGVHARNLAGHIVQATEARLYQAGLKLDRKAAYEWRNEILTICHRHLDAIQQLLDHFFSLETERLMAETKPIIVIKSGDPHA